MLRSPAPREHRQDDDGFSLVETVVALGLAATVLLGLLGAGLFSVKSAVTARQNASAGDLLNKALEDARSLDFAAITMRTTDLGTDPRISAGTPRTFNPGTGTAEAVDARDVGAIFPHIATQTTTNATYTVARYVTLPPGTVFDANGLPSARRLSVIVSWTQNGKLRTQTTSTIFTKTRRGLPLPFFTFAYNGPATVVGGTATISKNPGNDLSYGLLVRNQGARDAWTITSSTSSLGWRYYMDTDKNGIWSGDASPSGEPELSAASTGLLESGALPFYVVAHRVIGATESEGTTTTIFTATSEAQPTIPGKNVITSLIITNGAVVVPTSSASPTPSPTAGATPCTPGNNVNVVDDLTEPAATRPNGNAYSLTDLNLTNGPGTRDSTTQGIGTMSAERGALQSQLCNWSTDQQTNQAGRLLIPGGVAPFGVAEWRYKARSNNGESFDGTAVLVLHLQCVDPSVTLTASVSSVANNAPTLQKSATATSPSSCNAGGFRRLDIPLAFPGSFNVGTGANDYLSVKLTTSGNVRLAHGLSTPTSRLVVAVK
ncbi:MAG: hypothetical protein Q8R60_05045 [Mycobacteriales bacterium]|nr:hypothetical protein [Mycobacteriales bacterium]